MAPEDGENTVPVDPSTTRPTGGMYTYYCNTGYESYDTMTVRCMTDGGWSHPPPKCTSKKQCYSES